MFNENYEEKKLIYFENNKKNQWKYIDDGQTGKDADITSLSLRSSPIC